MSETPRRKRWQIHLSTAVVMMIAAGGLVWANVTGKPVDSISINDNIYLSPCSAYGWPLIMAVHMQYDPLRERNSLKHFDDVDYVKGAVNALVAVMIFFTVWFVCEWWIRRRAARKGT